MSHTRPILLLIKDFDIGGIYHNSINFTGYIPHVGETFTVGMKFAYQVKEVIHMHDETFRHVATTLYVTKVPVNSGN